MCRLCLLLALEILDMCEQAELSQTLKGDVQLPIRCRNKIAVLLVAAAYHRQRRSLHSSEGVVGHTRSQSQCTAGVHTHEPISLGTAVGSVVETIVSLAILEIAQTCTDSLVRE